MKASHPAFPIHSLCWASTQTGESSGKAGRGVATCMGVACCCQVMVLISLLQMHMNCAGCEIWLYHMIPSYELFCRARLVLAEHEKVTDSFPAHTSSKAASSDQPFKGAPLIRLEEQQPSEDSSCGCWAHALAVPEKGALLLAHPQLFQNQRHFPFAAVLLLDMDSVGYFGEHGEDIVHGCAAF